MWQGQPGNYVICVKAEDRVTHVRIRQVETRLLHECPWYSEEEKKTVFSGVLLRKFGSRFASDRFGSVRLSWRLTTAAGQEGRFG